MTVRNFSDQGFDDFRKQRKRMQAKLGQPATALGYDNQALRELEEVEQKEVREQRLTREVHDFFAAATRQAASIVERVAKDAMQETGARVEQEMESFLIDSLARMNNFVLTVLNQRRGPVAEAQMEPSVGNIVGPSLDEFRFAGTADTGDKHIGQDPFATAVEDVRREFREQIGQQNAEVEPPVLPIDQHLVAAVQAPEAPVESAPAAAATPGPTTPGRQPAAAPRAAPETDGAADPKVELERFKSALKALVRQGVMNREEALAAWQARLQTMGIKG